jgi:hypothetical protein
MYKTFDEVYDRLIELDLFTSEELDLVCNINGSSIDTLNDCLYARHGYRDLAQMEEGQE